MTDFLTKNRLVLAKVETTAGTDASPGVSTDAILVEEPRGTPNLELEQTNEVTGSLDSAQSIVGGGYGEHTYTIQAKGSGTAGTAPEYDPILQAAALARLDLAADQDDTAQAGDDAAITLASGATSNDLTGFVITLNGGTGEGQTRVITGYNGTSKVATVYPDWDVKPDSTSEYIVYKGNRYAPASTSLKTITSYLYKKNSGSGNAILEKLVGAAANISFAIQTRQTGKFTATVRGQLVAPGDVANPVAATFDNTRPRPLLSADAFLGGDRVCFRNFTLDLGNEVVQADCPGTTFGYEPARVASRRIGGRINPQLVTLSSRNAFADLIAGTNKKLWLRWGDTAGNRISIYLPGISYTGKEDDDLDGVSADGLPFDANGIDSGVYITFY